MGAPLLLFLSVQLVLGMLATLALYAWRRRRPQRLLRKDLQSLRLAFQRLGPKPESSTDFECCADAWAGDGDRARALCRLAPTLTPGQLGALLVFMGSRCGIETCAEILRHARHHPDPARLGETALLIVERSSSETLRLFAIEAIEAIGTTKLLPRLRTIARAPGPLSGRAARASQAIETRALRRPAQAGALSVVELAGGVSLSPNQGSGPSG